MHLYADDTVIYTSDSNILIQNSLQADFNLIQNCLHMNKLVINKKKSSNMLFGTRRDCLSTLHLHINFEDGSHG